MTLVLLVTGSCTRVSTSTAATTPVTTTTSQTTVNSTPATTTNSTTMSTTTTTTYTYTETTPLPLAGEATEFMGHKLTPISAQLNNAIKGTEYINQDTYRLTVDGLVDHPLSLSYADLQAYPQIDQLMD
jgi:DMSO/TMAO reductase YedYZ molybdopterin-dependent catalytic subunit